MRTAVTALLLLALLAPATAGAQEGPEVARHGDAWLEVIEDENELCVSLQVGSGRGSSTCGRPPAGRFDGSLMEVRDGRRSFAGGYVAPDTVEVEVELARGGRVRAPVVAGEAYQGRHRGRFGFFLVETTGAKARTDDAPVVARRLDAAGATIGAFGARDSAVLTGPVRLLHRHRSRSDFVRVTAAVTRSFEPSPIAIDRTGRSTCVAVRRPNYGGATCDEDGPFAQVLSLREMRGCGSLGGVVAGTARPEVASVELALGSGRRISRATRDLGALGSEIRAVALLVAPGQAVRSATALDANGRVLGRQQIGSPPAPRSCSGPGGTGNLLRGADAPRRAPLAPGGAQVVAGAAPGPRLLAGDAGDRLCLGIEFVVVDGCRIPPAELRLHEIDAIHRTAEYTAAGGVLPLEAAGVRIQFDAARWVAADMSDGGAYAGRYRGHVRFYLAHVPGRHQVTGIEILDAQGATVSAFYGPDSKRMHRRTIRRVRGQRLFGGRYDVRMKLGAEAWRDRWRCLGLAAPGVDLRSEECGLPDPGSFTGRVTCTPRGGVLVGQVGKGLRGVRARLAGGGELVSRTVRVPAAFGGGRVWLVSIPPSAEIVRLRYVGRPPRSMSDLRRRQTIAYPVPAPREQCGYAVPTPAAF